MVSNRKKIFIVILFIIVSPIIAFLVADYRYNHTNASTPITTTTSELFSAINKYSQQNPDSRYPSVHKVVSYKQMDNWWYVAIVEVDDTQSSNTTNVPMLLAKFGGNPNDIRIVTGPNEKLTPINISNSATVPYDVIDELNKIIDSGVK